MSSFRRRLLMVNKKVYYRITSNIANGNIYFDDVDTGFTTDSSGFAVVEILESQAKDSYSCTIKNGEFKGNTSTRYTFTANSTTVHFVSTSHYSQTVLITSRKEIYSGYSAPTKTVEKNGETVNFLCFANFVYEDLDFNISTIDGYFAVTKSNKYIIIHNRALYPNEGKCTLIQNESNKQVIINITQE